MPRARPPLRRRAASAHGRDLRRERVDTGEVVRERACGAQHRRRSRRRLPPNPRHRSRRASSRRAVRARAPRVQPSALSAHAWASAPNAPARSPPTALMRLGPGAVAVVRVGIAEERGRGRERDLRRLGLRHRVAQDPARRRERARRRGRRTGRGGATPSSSRRSRDSCPRRAARGRRAAAARAPASAAVIVGEHTVGPVHITSTSAGSPAAESRRDRAIAACRRTRSGNRQRATSGSRARSAVEQRGRERGVTRAEARLQRDVVEQQQEPRSTPASASTSILVSSMRGRRPLRSRCRGRGRPRTRTAHRPSSPRAASSANRAVSSAEYGSRHSARCFASSFGAYAYAFMPCAARKSIMLEARRVRPRRHRRSLRRCRATLETSESRQPHG